MSILILRSSASGGGGGGGSFLFSDDLTSGDRTHTENGISWGGSAGNVSVASGHSLPSDAGGGTGNVILMNYPGDTVVDVPQEGNAEQDMLYSTPMTEVWKAFYIQPPANFYHRDGTTSAGPSPSGTYNNKGLGYFWDGDYSSGPGPGIGPNNFPGSALPDISLLAGEDRQKCYLFNGFGKPGGGHFDEFLDGGDPAKMGYGFVTADYGQWLHIVIHVKYATSANNDGVYQLWRRRNGAGSYTKLLNFTNIAMYVPASAFPGSIPGFDHYRVLGYSNSGFAQSTTFKIWRMQVAASNQWGVS